MVVKRYKLQHKIRYFSLRYKKWITVPKGYPSDGATGARDIKSQSWWVHDWLCDYGVFDDGTQCNNWQASMIVRDILLDEDRWFRAHTWFVMTWLVGGGAARKNGMF